MHTGITITSSCVYAHDGMHTLAQKKIIFVSAWSMPACQFCRACLFHARAKATKVPQKKDKGKPGDKKARKELDASIQQLVEEQQKLSCSDQK